MNKIEAKIGFWAAILSAFSAILWFIPFSMQDLIHAMPDWSNLQTYAEAFSPLRVLYVYPSLILAITYIILLACIHRLVPEDKKIWTLMGLATGIVYSVMASINYNIQAVAVRLSLAAGEVGGIEMFLPDNTNGIFNALANSYVYLAISMFFIGFVFTQGKLARWIRFMLLAQVITALGQVAYTMLDMNESIFIATSMVWVIGAPTVFFILAAWFKKTANTTA